MTERDFQQPPGTRYRLLQSMYRNKTSIIWPLIASFAASSFFVTALVVVIFLFIAMAYQAATQPSVESLSFALAEWVQAFGLILVMHIVLQAATRVLWWRESAQQRSARTLRSWPADLSRVVIIDAVYSIFRFGLWTCQIIAWIGLFRASDPTKSALYIALSATLLLVLAIVYRSCLAAQWCGTAATRRGALGFLSSIASGIANVKHRPFEAIVYFICPKLAFFACLLCMIWAFYAQAHFAWIALAALGLLISNWIEPFLWFHRVPYAPPTSTSR